MGSRYSVHGGQGPGRQLDLPLRITWPGEAGGPRPRAASQAQRSTPGARSWAGRAPGWRSRPSKGRLLWAVRGSRAPRGGSARPLAGTPARSGLSAKPAGGGQWGGWLVSRGASTRPLPPPPLRCSAAPTPPHFQRQLSPRQQERARGWDLLREEGAATGNFLQQRGALQSPAATTSATMHPLSLSRQEARRRGRGGAREDTEQDASSWGGTRGKVSSNTEPSQDASGEDSTIPCLPLR